MYTGQRPNRGKKRQQVGRAAQIQTQKKNSLKTGS
jgi:hypothetical protein